MPVTQDEQQTYDSAITRLVLSEMYEDDNFAELTIDIQADRAQALFRSEQQSIIFPPDDLITAIGDLIAAHRRERTGLARVEYKYLKQPNGRWRMEGDFSYQDS